MDIFLFLGGIFLLTFLLGILLEKIRITWIFAAMIIGLALAFYNPFLEITSSESFEFLAWLGMYSLIFLVGFELEIEKIRKLGKFIIRSTFLIIFFEAIFGSLLIHFVFGYSWFISALVALSFATVGKAILIPILEEFKLTGTKLGKTILGIGTINGAVEIFVVLMAILIAPALGGEIEKEDGALENIWVALFYLSALSIFTFGIVRSKKEEAFLGRLKGVEIIFLLVLAMFFLFVGIGNFAGIATIGALLAGIAVKNFLPKDKIISVESKIKTITYACFTPVFFFWVGVDVDSSYLLASPFLVLLVVIIAKSAKIFASIIIGKKELGLKPSILMGIALGVRFSTSIIIIKFLFEKAVIGVELYSVLIASIVVFKFIIPFLISFLIGKWKITPQTVDLK